jgi:hypothetical protein
MVLLGGLAGVGGYSLVVLALDIREAKSLPALLRRRNAT